MKLVMLVGFPGAGKSTLAKEYENKGYVVHSPDVIRNELDLHSLDDTQRVFDILHERILVDMMAKKDIVYDSTNLTVRRRRKFLSLIRDFACDKTCCIVDTPLSLCKYRNNKRTGYAKVEDTEFDRMVSVYEEPTYMEGWDHIIKYKEDVHV